MRVNKTKARLAAGEIVVGCFLSYAELSLAEFVALQGSDFLVFDGKHGPLEPRDVQDLCRGADVRGVTPIVRVPTNQPHIMGSMCSSSGLPIYRNHSVYPARSTTPTSRPQ